MSVLPHRLWAGTVGWSSQAGVYTVPAGTNVVLTSLIVCNWSTDPTTADVSVGGLPVLSKMSVAAGDTFALDTSIHMPAGTSLACGVSVAGGVSVYASGVISDS